MHKKVPSPSLKSAPSELYLAASLTSTTYQYLRDVSQRKRAAFIVLIDPDKLAPEALPTFLDSCHVADVDAVFVGGSLLQYPSMDTYLEALRRCTDLPIIGFPGSIRQLSSKLDAVLYLSIISGRNPEYLFGQHVHAAPIIKKLGIEPISTGYMLIESGRATTAQYISHTNPLPRHKPELAAATAIAAEMMGMKLLYTDGGSGADLVVPDDVIAAITEQCTIPLVVGGGLNTPELVAQKVKAGAKVVVVGTALERRPDRSFLTELVGAAHESQAQSFRS